MCEVSGIKSDSKSAFAPGRGVTKKATWGVTKTATCNVRASDGCDKESNA